MNQHRLQFGGRVFVVVAVIIIGSTLFIYNIKTIFKKKMKKNYRKSYKHLKLLIMILRKSLRLNIYQNDEALQNTIYKEKSTTIINNRFNHTN